MTSKAESLQAITGRAREVLCTLEGAREAAHVDSRVVEEATILHREHGPHEQGRELPEREYFAALDLAALQRKRTRHGQPHHTGTDDDAVDVFHRFVSGFFQAHACSNPSSTFAALTPRSAAA